MTKCKPNFKKHKEKTQILSCKMNSSVRVNKRSRINADNWRKKYWIFKDNIKLVVRKKEYREKTKITDYWEISRKKTFKLIVFIKV